MNPVTIIFALMAIALMVPVGIHVLNDQSRQTMATVAALQMARIQKAAEGYITANAAAIEGTATSTNPATITIPMLVNTGYLPNGFQANNPYGQTWEVQVLQPSPGQLQALVLSTGGNPVPTRSLGLAAQIAGAAGGVVGGGSGTSSVPGCGAGQACGVYSGWKVPTSGFNAQPGHLAALIEYSNGQIQNDYLYRVSVPGQPQLNQMQTNLDMGNNNVNNAYDVNANHNVEAGPAGQCVENSEGHCTGEIEAAGTTQADLPSGWQGGMTTRDLMGVNGTVAEGTPGSPQAYMNDYGDGSAGGGGEVAAVDPSNGNYAVMNSSNTGSAPEIYTNGIVDAGNGFGAGSYFGFFNGSWMAFNGGNTYQWGSADINGNANVGGQVRAGYDVTLGTAGGSANIGQGCSPNGAIAANANGSGQVLACEGGKNPTWQAMGGGVTYEGNWWLQYGGVENIGYYTFCAQTGFITGFGGSALIYPVAGPYPGGIYLWQAQSLSDVAINVSCWDAS
ncbi:prepilin [Acidithiobacillus caldus SM-1]|uniref:Prepilin n=1 Tax=Acidithiobacillus caldus (strain SM-1) TaxID=990288 RepID=F9ZMR5_ACICS|nr:shufflon system plasmid conjugative transfer pilus tip adhesin PilV [Acidithiobacillus caldus]AEK57825.1 prepilin [Acidithiobacillus caldus SM-1]